MPHEETQVYDIEGMTCSSCAMRVEKRLQETPGVDSATVNFASGKAFVSGEAKADTLAKRLDEIGYKLVLPEKGKEEEHLHAHAVAQARRLWTSVALTVPLMGIHWAGLHGQTAASLEFVLASLIVAGPGRGFFVRAVKLLRHGSSNMDTLISLGVGASFAYGATLFFLGRHGPYYFDAAGMILSFVLLGKYLEAKATARAGAALRALLDLSPKFASRIDGGETRQVPVVEVMAGDLLRVAPGERIPVDGKVEKGTSEIDESLATGESLPVTRVVGDPVLGGTINGSGVLEIRATGVGAESFLAQMVRLVEEAQGSKPPIQRLADKISAVFVPVVLLLAAGTALGWYLTGHGLVDSLLPGVAVLLIACPCALGLATPTAVLASSGRAAKEGVLVRNGAALETSARLTALVADKTGTLTEGRPKVVGFLNNVGEGRETEIFSLAAALERGSEHPIGKAILSYCEEHGATSLEAADVTAEAGAGISGTVEGKTVRLGTFEFAKKHGVDLRRLLRESTDHPVASRAYLIVGERLYAVFYLEDTIRADAREALAALKGLGITIHMATGDTSQVAHHIAGQLGIENVRSGLRPEEKNALVAELRAKGEVVGMVGDGINDAPALAAADVGFAIGTGTDVALQSADVTLVGGDLSRVARAIELSRRTLRIIRENLFWALFYNVAAIPVAALGYLKPQIAAGAMAASSVCVVTNSLRLQRMRRRKAAPEVGGQQAGGDVGELEIPVEGMSCQNCAGKVKKALEETKGVEGAEVLLEEKLARVRYNRTETTVAILKNAIRSAGYKVGEVRARESMGYYASKEEDFRIT